MNRQTTFPRARRPLVAATAFALTWLALPVSSVMAQSFPSYPLQTGAGNVEPNIMFILDDSGSMSYDYMDNPTIPTICYRSGNSCDGDTITSDTYPGNTIQYDPRVTYQTWMQANGSRMSGGTSMSGVYTSSNFAGPGYSTSNRTGNVHTFYAPKDFTQAGAAYLGDTANYYRYQVRSVGGTSRVVRSELLEAVTSESTFVDSGLDANSGMLQVRQFTVPAGTTRLVVESNGGRHGTNNGANDNNGDGADLYVRRGGWPGTSWWEYNCRDAGGNNNETCTINNPDPGTWYVSLRADSRFRDVTVRIRIIEADPLTGESNAGCATSTSGRDWRNCTFATPNGRSEADELTNYATWYSYHRTRMKIAKAGAAEAFHQLGDNVRVGYRSLHENNSNSNYDIPVEDGSNGVFSGTARNAWYDKLFNASANSGTPLRGALESTGEYFKSSESSGPWGPGSAANQLACRQSFAILTTDGYWNSNFGDITVGNQDGTDGSEIENPADNTDVVRYTASHPFRDGEGVNRSNTLADVAMKYWKEDLRDDLDNIVPTSTNNPAFWQHMVTFGISIGLKGTVDQTSVAQVLAAGRPRINGVAVSWPDPQMSNTDGLAQIAARIDDLLHAAVNGRGEFVAANSAEEFGTALNSVLGQIQSRLASGSNVATNSTSYQSNSRIYQATYRSVQWTGELLSRPISAAGISPTPEWAVTQRISASYQDGSTANDYSNRTVLTWNGSQGADFPTAGQETDLARGTGAAQVTGAQNAAYIKGSQSLERANGGTLRNRVTPFGDIINSSPFYVPDTETIYVGANDGMLHGIDAVTGDVWFSYVPAGVSIDRLRDLSDPAYGHAYFVDGQVTVSTSRVTPGENLLVGALGRGGKGVFALDVSDPDAMSGGNNGDVLWDKTATADADMGYVLGAPVIVKANNGQVVALVPNGIESTNGDAVLYVIRLDTGNQSGTVLAKISTGNTSGNGLSTPRTADTDGDGTVDYVYAGDMLGNMWKFDLTSSNPASWGVALGGEPLFIARGPGGAVQAITGAPALARETAENRIWVTFGTGRFIYESDVTDQSIQTWYGVIDDGTAELVRADLTERDIVATGVDGQGRDIRAFERNSALPEDSMGWYIDLDEPLDGERVIGSARINGRSAVVSSMAPTVSSGCENEGAGFLNAIDLFTGASPADEGGGAASYFDIDGDGSGTSDGDFLTDADGNPVGVGSVDAGVGAHYDSRNMEGDYVICGSNGVCEVVEGGVPPGGGAETRRLSWREIFGED